MAKEIEIVDNSNFYDDIYISDNVSVPIKKIEKVDFRSGKMLLEESGFTRSSLKKLGFDISSLDYIYVKDCKGNTYKILEKGSPYKDGDAYVDNLEKYWFMAIYKI